MADRRVQKAMIHFRKEFQGKEGIQASMPMIMEDYKLFPVLKEKGFEFIEVTRIPTGKLKVEFI